MRKVDPYIQALAAYQRGSDCGMLKVGEKEPNPKDYGLSDWEAQQIKKQYAKNKNSVDQ